MSAARRLGITEAYQQYYSRWNPEAASASIRRHLYDLQRWRKVFGEDTPVGEVSTDMYQEFRRRSADRGDKPRTTETTLATVRMVLRLAKINGAIPNEPDRGRSRRIVPSTPDVPDMAAFGRLYEATDDKLVTWPRLVVPPSVWWKVALVVGVWTALRRNDLFWRLSWDHIDPVEKVIRIKPEKERGRERAFPLTDVVWRHIQALTPQGQRRLVFGPSRSIDKIRRELRLLSARADVYPAVTPQTLRRCGVNMWADADEYAGMIVQGSGIKRIWMSYRDQVRRLQHVAEQIEWPSCVQRFGVVEAERQLTLF